MTALADTLILNGQAFSVIGFREHTNRHGYPAPLVVLEAACKQCGSRFQTAVRRAKKLLLENCRKRCLECSPPKPTKPRPEQDLSRPEQNLLRCPK
jgi:hypothetical protein